MKKRMGCLLLFVFFAFISSPLFAAEMTEKGNEPGEHLKVVSKGPWELDVGGQIRFRGDFAKNQNSTNFAFTPGHKEPQFLERTRLQASVEDHALNLEAFVQGQWYGRWGGLDNRSAFDLYQGYIGWDKILGSPISLRGGPSGIFIWLCILSRHK